MKKTSNLQIFRLFPTFPKKLEKNQNKKERIGKLNRKTIFKKAKTTLNHHIQKIQTQKNLKTNHKNIKI